ncbi:MAG: TrmB family transcriptional regulator [Candidatus Levyibacteriota bacterium]
MNEPELLNELEQFGLNRIEARIYLHLLNKQPKTILEISKELSLPRTSIYDNTLKLAEKGLIQKIVKYKSQKLQAYPLSILQELIEKEREKINSLQKNLISLEESLRQTTMPPLATEVRYYQGREGFSQMMWNALSAEKETIGYSVFGRTEVVGDSFVNRWQEELTRKNIVDRVITTGEDYKATQSFVYPQRDKYQQIRFAKKGTLHISGDTTIYNNIFAVAYWKQGEVVGVEIENEELVKTQKSILTSRFRYPKTTIDA